MVTKLCATQFYNGCKASQPSVLSACILNSTKRGGVELKLLGGRMSNDVAPM
jgi:hypothetical protein